MDSALKIGETARLLRVSTKTLRHYEKIGLIAPGRLNSGYRLYSLDDLLRLKRIRRLQTMGLSLVQINALLNEGGNSDFWQVVLGSLLEGIESEIEDLEVRREEVETLLDELDMESAPAPDVLVAPEMSVSGISSTDYPTLVRYLEIRAVQADLELVKGYAEGAFGHMVGAVAGTESQTITIPVFVASAQWN